jgi:hypothetical protein
MGTVAEFRGPKKDQGAAAAHSNGVADGLAARAKGVALTLYLQVGIDEYAKGFRAGFFGHINLGTVD